MKKYLFLFILLPIFISNQTYSQVLEGELNFHGFADNREYAKSGRYSQTIFGARIAPEVGLLIDSTHRIRIGLNAVNEYGDTKFFKHIDPILYYQYRKNKLDLFIGAFPRLNLIDDYPKALLSDTLNYFRSNIEGMLLKYESKKFKQLIWMDWTGKQTALNRETFLFGLSGKYQSGSFFVSHYAYMFHNALSAVSPPNQHLEDNGAIQAQLGLDFSKKTFLDSLTIAAGAMISIERIRNVTGLNTPMGFINNLYASYKKVSIAHTLYFGEGHNLIFGDKFYTSKVYNRSDFSWSPIMYKNIQGVFTFSLHFVDKVIDSQQAFSLKYRIRGNKKIGK